MIQRVDDNCSVPYLMYTAVQRQQGPEAGCVSQGRILSDMQ